MIPNRNHNESLLLRLSRAFTVQDKCWIWNGYTNPSGHAAMRYQGRKQGAHRVTYEYFVGKIPEGLVLDHLCKRPACINPKHLEPVKQGENVRRIDNNPVSRQMKRDNECKEGHKFTPENTYLRSDAKGRGIRECRTCRTEASKRFRMRRLELNYV